MRLLKLLDILTGILEYYPPPLRLHLSFEALTTLMRRFSSPTQEVSEEL